MGIKKLLVFKVAGSKIFIARKRSFGQGNMFTGVCLSTGGGGAWSRGVPGGDPPPTATAAGGTHPTGMHSCLTNMIASKHFGLLPPATVVTGRECFHRHVSVRGGG